MASNSNDAFDVGNPALQTSAAVAPEATATATAMAVEDSGATEAPSAPTPLARIASSAANFLAAAGGSLRGGSAGAGASPQAVAGISDEELARALQREEVERAQAESIAMRGTDLPPTKPPKPTVWNKGQRGGGGGDRSSVRSVGSNTSGTPHNSNSYNLEGDSSNRPRSMLVPQLIPDEELPVAAAMVEAAPDNDAVNANVRHISHDGRVLVTSHQTYRGRPASVTVELGPDGHVKAIVDGTARLPGESQKEYFRQMSSFALNQIREEPPTPKIAWRGNQKYAWFSYVIIIVTGCILLAEIARNGWQLETFSMNPSLGPSKQVLLDMGAKRTDLIRAGEYQRLIAPIFLHGGILHWLFNMLAVYSLIMAMEKEFGSPKIAIIYLLAGFIGVLTSCVFLPDRMGVGASGAIFGVYGAAWSDVIVNWSLYKAQGEAYRKL